MQQSTSLYLTQLELGPMQNFVYLLGDPATREAAVIDPGWEIATILETLRRDDYRLRHIFVTHTHFDHVGGVAPLVEQTDAQVHVHAAEAARLAVEPGNVVPVDSGGEVLVGRLPVTCIHTPGHTPGSQCVYVDGKLLSGDTLFIQGCGRCDLPGGDAAELYRSLTQRLRRLDDQTVLYPGHHYAAASVSTLGRERRANPFLQAPSLRDFLSMVGVGS